MKFLQKHGSGNEYVWGGLLGLFAILGTPNCSLADAANLESFDSGIAVTEYKNGYPVKRRLPDGEIVPIPLAVQLAAPAQKFQRNWEISLSRRFSRGDARDGVFFGDSLLSQIGGLSKDPDSRKIWQKMAGEHAFLNAGVPADRVGNTLSKLWLVAPTARLVAIQIGSNDHRADRPKSDPAETAEGIARLVAEALYRAPQAKILLIAIPPSTAAEVQIAKNQRANTLIRKLADHERVFFVDPGDRFDPTKEALLKDGVHFTAEGFIRWYTPLILWTRAALAGGVLPPVLAQDPAH